MLQQTRIFNEIKLFILATIIFGLIVIAAGIYTESNSPMYATGNDILNPLPGIVKSDLPGSPSQVLIALSQSLLIAGILLGTSIAQFGVASLAFFFFYCAALGGNAAWFAKFPATSFWHGLLAFGSHAIFEFTALAIITAFSLWVGYGAIMPGEGNSRWSTLKVRFGKVIYVIPAIVTLFLVSVLVEATVSIPLERHFAQAALASEVTKKVKDSEGKWSMDVPVSWERTYYQNASENEDSFVLLSSTIPVFIEIRTSKLPGIFSQEDFKEYYEPVVQQQIQTLGLTPIQGPIYTEIDNYPAYLLKFTGSDSTINADDTYAKYYTIWKADEATGDTELYGIFIRGLPSDWNDFSEPLIHEFVETFHISS